MLEKPRRKNEYDWLSGIPVRTDHAPDMIVMVAQIKNEQTIGL